MKIYREKFDGYVYNMGVDKTHNYYANGILVSNCYRGSSPDGKHANIVFLNRVVHSLNMKTEFSVGGGNILEYPDLRDFFKTVKDTKHNHILNVTINANDVGTVIDDYKDSFEKYVDGIGVSVDTVADIYKWADLVKAFPDKYITVHMIPEMLGFEKTMEIIKELNGYKKVFNVNILFLGFKQTGRASEMNYTVFTDEQLTEIFDAHYSIGVDTTFINRYETYLDKEFEETTFTKNEGEFSMYIDAVNEKGYVSSYNLEQPIDMSTYEWGNVDEAFEVVRKQCGFEVFKKYYE